jgi:hypothetical protein
LLEIPAFAGMTFLKYFYFIPLFPLSLGGRDGVGDLLKNIILIFLYKFSSLSFKIPIPFHIIQK